MTTPIDLTITLLKTGEPPPAWKPASAASHDDQRAFAKRVLIRLWEKYGADPEKTGASRCIEVMAGIDPNLALEWSAQHGHRYDDAIRRVQARELAETDAPGALALLNQEPDSESQPVLQSLAERFAETEPQKAMLVRRGGCGAGPRAGSSPNGLWRWPGPGRSWSSWAAPTPAAS